MKVELGELTRVTEVLLVQAGVPTANAATTATVLTRADMWGIASHGVSRLPIYLDRLAAGGCDPGAELEVKSDTGPAIALHGHDGLGHWQVWEATNLGLVRAREYGVAVVTVSHSSHCGALGVYASRAAEEGLVALVFSSGPPAMPAWNGRQPILSTSPIAAGFPIDSGNAVIDMALSKVARGKIARHAAEGKPLPEGWAMDADGRPTTDPGDALRGMLAPMGDAKGFALAFMVEALSAAMVGPNLSSEVPDFFDARCFAQPQRIGHTLVVLDPELLAGDAQATAARERFRGLADIVTESGGRVPGATRVPLSDHADGQLVDVADDLWRELHDRMI